MVKYNWAGDELWQSPDLYGSTVVSINNKRPGHLILVRCQEQEIEEVRPDRCPRRKVLSKGELNLTGAATCFLNWVLVSAKRGTRAHCVIFPVKIDSSQDEDQDEDIKEDTRDFTAGFTTDTDGEPLEHVKQLCIFQNKLVALCTSQTKSRLVIVDGFEAWTNEVSP
jgi:hypothetical protein